MEVKRMRKIIVAATAALVLAAMFCTVASAAEIKLGYINLRKVQSDSIAGKEAIKTLEDLVKDKQAQIEQRKNEIQKMQQELDKQSAVISAAERSRRQDKLQRAYKDYQRFASDSEDELAKKKEELASKMFDEVAAVIEKYGKEEGYTLILDRSVVLYAPEAVDITDKIIKAYDDTKATTSESKPKK
jgi:outer membrane protein